MFDQNTTFGAIQAGNVFMFVPDISSIRGAASNVINLLDSKPEIIDANLTVKEPVGRIRFEDIHFCYPLDLASVSSVAFPSPSNLVPLLPPSDRPVQDNQLSFNLWSGFMTLF